MQLFENFAFYFEQKGDEAECRNAQFSLYFSLLIFIAYCVITVLIGFGKSQDDGNIQIVLHFLYMVQQLSFFLRYKPLSNTKEIDLYISASGVQLMTFVCLVMTPAFPFKYFAFPVAFTYSVGFWGVYFQALTNDIRWHEASIKYFTYALPSVFIAYVHQ